MNRIFFALSALFAVACSRSEVVDVDDFVDADAPIEILTVTTPSTKGEMVSKAEDMLSLGVYCAHTGDVVWSKTAEFEKLDNDRFCLADDGRWSIDGDVVEWGYGSLSDNYTFLAYSPHESDAKGISSRIVDGELFIDYTVPSSSVDQPDLMYAEPRKDLSPQLIGGVSLSFCHALASVKFSVISSEGVMIEAIYINGVVGEGSLEWDYESSTPHWTPGNVSGDPFSVEIDTYTNSADTSVQVNTDRGYLMMIPQTLTNGAEVVLMLDNNEQRTLSIPENSVWTAGSIYNYIINLDDDENRYIYDSDSISNCYIINPTNSQETTIQIPIQTRINNFWKNYTDNKSNKIKVATTTAEIFVDMVWQDFDKPFEYTYEVIDDADEKMAVRFVVTSEFQEGNFVFVVYEIEIVDDKPQKSPLWSWHLWFTEYNPDAIAAANLANIEANVDRAYTLDGYEGAVHRYKDASGAANPVWSASGIYGDKFIMDRNIGERDEYAADYGAGTVLYEFGRKDPFPGNGATYASGGSQPSVRSSSAFTFEQSVEFHSDYISSDTSSSGNWSIESAARLYSCIWFDSTLSVSGYDEGKSIFDPSPLGWRVPVIATWSTFNDSESCDNIASVGKYNLCGYRDPYNSAQLTNSGTVGSVWSANPYNAEQGYSLFYRATKVSSPSTYKMTYGLPVRAIQE